MPGAIQTSSESMRHEKIHDSQERKVSSEDLAALAGNLELAEMSGTNPEGNPAVSSPESLLKNCRDIIASLEEENIRLRQELSRYEDMLASLHLLLQKF